MAARVSFALFSLLAFCSLLAEAAPVRPDVPVSNGQQVHACVPANSCDPQTVTGIDITYSCKCYTGFTGDYCDRTDTSVKSPAVRSFVDQVAVKKIEAANQFFCQYVDTKCANGQAVIQSKTPICG
ncbi:hypothetical protein M3Y99_01498800 [Aphelenchoides fujianensis]|nr:hypothetical protein M3Y99_01498800 [Aphelenchoides fujianensis]